MAGSSDVRISARGGTDTRLVQCSGIAASWELNTAGVFNGVVPLADLNAAGYGMGTDLRGYWLDYEHPSAGRWGGVISNTRATPDGLELGAEQFHVLLRKRLVTLIGPKQEPEMGTPGGLFLRLLELAAQSGPLYLARGTIEQGGEQIGVEWQDVDAYDEAVPSLVDDTGNYWRVDADRVVSFGRRPGRDLRSSVRLVYGRSIARYETTLDLWSAENLLVGLGRSVREVKQGNKVKRVATKIRVTEQNATSIAQFGPFEGVRAFGGSNSAEGIRKRLRAILDVLAFPKALVTLTVVDVDGAFAAFVEGDTITAELPSSTGTLALQVLSRALADDGSMLVATEVV